MITAIITIYKRPQHLAEQYQAIANQTVPPEEIWILHNGYTNTHQFEYPEGAKVIRSDKNFMFHGRFALGLLARTPYVAMLDDDTIPGPYWFETCLAEMEKQEGLYATAGVIYQKPGRRGRRIIGWPTENPHVIEVDYAGHGWFLKQEWVKYMWYDNPITLNNCEDIQLSYALRKYAGISTYVTPHPQNNKQIWGSTKGHYGSDKVSAHHTQKSFFDEREDVITKCIKKGWPMVKDSPTYKRNHHKSVDPAYGRRNPDRANFKTNLVVQNMSKSDTVLDIGCNSGYIAEGLLKAGKAQKVDGIELDKAMVNPILISNPHFTLHQCDITEFPFNEEIYDSVVYAAVHHHVAGLYGMDKAISTWQNIANHCNETIIFEMGGVIENNTNKSILYWKDAIAQHFKTDQEHLDFLINVLGDRVLNVEEIAHYDINNASRPIYKIDLHPIRYKCIIIPGTHTASKSLAPWFNAWAQTEDISLVPGTLNLCADKPVMSPTTMDISLIPYDHALQAHQIWTDREGYNPKLYPCRVNGFQAWLFRWSDNGYTHNFVNDTLRCKAQNHCEIISPHLIASEDTIPLLFPPELYYPTKDLHVKRYHTKDTPKVKDHKPPKPQSPSTPKHKSKIHNWRRI